MLFDFNFFMQQLKVAYRRTECDFSFDEVADIFSYYFRLFELVMDRPHPNLRLDQIERIVGEITSISIPDSNHVIELEPEDYPLLIDQHFATKYWSGCDYGILHFFSGEIRAHRYFEVMVMEEQE